MERVEYPKFAIAKLSAFIDTLPPALVLYWVLKESKESGISLEWVKKLKFTAAIFLAFIHPLPPALADDVKMSLEQVKQV